MISEEDRFWSKVDRTKYGCWEWMASKNERGYGRYRHDGRATKAHRVAYLLAISPIPPGMHVLHRCDNPGCCRPDHLFLGTHAENMRDLFAKNRRVAREG